MIISRLLMPFIGRRLRRLEVASVPLLLREHSASELVKVAKREFADSQEYLIYTGGTTVFFKQRPPQSFGYEIPGTWVWGNDEEMLQPAEATGGVVGVMLLPAAQLRFSPEDTLFAKAAGRITRLYKKAVGLPFSIEFLEFPCPRFKAMIWKASFGDPNNPESHFHAEKVFLAIGEEWLAQLTVEISPRSQLVKHEIIESMICTFGATSDKDGYLPFMSEQFGELPPGLK